MKLSSERDDGASPCFEVVGVRRSERCGCGFVLGGRDTQAGIEIVSVERPQWFSIFMIRLIYVMAVSQLLKLD